MKVHQQFIILFGLLLFSFINLHAQEVKKTKERNRELYIRIYKPGAVAKVEDYWSRPSYVHLENDSFEYRVQKFRKNYSSFSSRSGLSVGVNTSKKLSSKFIGKYGLGLDISGLTFHRRDSVTETFILGKYRDYCGWKRYI